MSADTIVPGAGSLTISPNDPVTAGVWSQRGASANPQQLNRYSYVLNNPVRNVDPTGHMDADGRDDLRGMGPGPSGGGGGPVSGSGDKDDRPRSGVQGDGSAGEGRTPTTLYHYTNKDGMEGIESSQVINPSTAAKNPNDVRYGEGQYFSDIVPGTKTPAQLSKTFINNPYQGKKYDHFVAINVEGLDVTVGRPGVYVILNKTPLDVSTRIVGSGPVPR